MLKDVSLSDKYEKQTGRIFITGVQALVRLLLLQSARDKAEGLHTAAYVTGYRGSPLGGLDLQLWQARDLLENNDIVFQPGINEDLAATALWGTQQAEIDGQGRYDGVFGLWYGKGPGVDRSGDVFRHANLAGTSRYGGVLVAMGDDHACESSTTAHQSEYALVDAMMPILNPSGVRDILEFGLTGWALSRYSGCWVGLKCVHDTVEATASVDIDHVLNEIVLPDNGFLPEEGLNIRWPDTPLEQEQRLHELKLPAVQSFWQANSLDKTIFDSPSARIGIVTTGKSYSDVRRAFIELDIDEKRAADLNIRLYKVALSWPLARDGLYRFVEGLEKIIVVEEKRGLIEDQIKTLLYRRANVPVIVGKFDEVGEVLLPSIARLNAMQIADAIGQQLLQHIDSESLRSSVSRVRTVMGRDRDQSPMQRVPYFCAGCPHNTSTKVPEGSVALAGIGCHYMAQWMDRSTARFTQMGGEGASWIGESCFSKRKHVFQNIGDGTYLHSGLLAVRAAVATKTPVTFKVLYNDAVAMTGGQPFDAPLSVSRLAQQLLAEGVSLITIITDDLDKYRSRERIPDEVDVVDRSELDVAQKELREHSGVTAIIYDQTCAAEKRRRRKRGVYPDPPKRVFINTQVCEGCGDCGTQSNCVAILPDDTELGRKRRIDQSACNKDYTCVEGFCPSFVTVNGGQVRKPNRLNVADEFDPAVLPLPKLPSINKEFCIVVTGVGGTGVITASAILGMAAHIDELGCSVLDMTGLAQKGGAVVSNLVIAPNPEQISTMHVASGGAHLILGCDLVVTASEKVILTAANGVTEAVVNDYEMMSGEFTRIRDLNFPQNKLKSVIERATGEGKTTFVNANRYANDLFGDTIAANMFIIGIAFQKGCIPISAEAIIQAIELNGRSAAMNIAAFHRGRQFIADRQQLDRVVRSDSVSKRNSSELTLDELIEHRSELLVSYQSKSYAQRFRNLVAKIRAAEKKNAVGMKGLTEAVVRSYFKLLAYKDEYEVARLFTDGVFTSDLQSQFEGDYKIQYHMAPPLLTRKNKVTGLPQKITFSQWMTPLLRVLAKFKILRGTVLDPFGWSQDRKLEKALIYEYETVVEEVCRLLHTENHRLAIKLACYPQSIRGYGHIKRKSYNEIKPQIDQMMNEMREDAPKPQVA